MTPAQRARYFKELWPAACQVKGWNVRDEVRRKLTTSDCMAAVRGLATGSTSLLNDDEVTALFCYLEFLAHPDDLDRSARWLDCQEDHQAYNRARQADWHENKLFGGRKSKLTRDRFGGEKSAVNGPLEPFDPEAARKRHLTMASRHQKQMRAEKGQKMASQPVASAPAPVEQLVSENPF